MTALIDEARLAWDPTRPARVVAQVIQKLADGTYPTEATRCLCGADEDTVITEWDRYTIPHRMVMCEACCLIRANPRMTADAYREFYNNEYRLIYDGFPYQERSEDDEYLFTVQVGRGVQVKEFVEELDCHPTSVLDIGCDKGGTLMPFKEAGLTVQGVELCARGRAYCATRDIPTVATMDELIDEGKTFDLIIMQDLVEHLLDLHELVKVAQLLAPKGRLFLYTPGLLATNPSTMFQNAHTYQFLGATLEFVMERFGWTADFLDDRIVSFWQYTGFVDPFPLKPTHWRRHIDEHLRQVETRALPPVRTKCKFTETEMLGNLKANLPLQLPTIDAIQDTFSGECLVIGGGPSVDDQLDTIKALAARGVTTVVIERMYPWCHQHGLKADIVVSLDASEGIEAGFTHLQPDAIHLMVATNNPKVFPLLTGYKQYLWSGAAGSHPDAAEMWRANGYPSVTVVNTGGSVTLASVMLSLMLGFRQVHLFGFDCMTGTPAHDYASGIAGESVQRTYMQVTVGGAQVWTCSSFLSFAQQFFSMMDIAKSWKMLEAITVYGDSLVTHMLDSDPDGVVRRG